MTAANERDVELNKRREIPHLQATMYYFVHDINRIALFWREKPTLLMNENKGIENSRIKIAQWVRTVTTATVTLLYQHVIEWVSATANGKIKKYKTEWKIKWMNEWWMIYLQSRCFRHCWCKKCAGRFVNINHNTPHRVLCNSLSSRSCNPWSVFWLSVVKPKL